MNDSSKIEMRRVLAEKAMKSRLEQAQNRAGQSSAEIAALKNAKKGYDA